MDLEQQLRERFKKAARDLIDPPVLVSDKWLRPGPGEGEYEFMGTLKMAKATGRKPERIATQLLDTVTLDDLGFQAKITASGVIILYPMCQKSDKTDQAPADQASEDPQ